MVLSGDALNMATARVSVSVSVITRAGCSTAPGPAVDATFTGELTPLEKAVRAEEDPEEPEEGVGGARDKGIGWLRRVSLVFRCAPRGWRIGVVGGVGCGEGPGVGFVRTRRGLGVGRDIVVAGIV